MQEFIGFINQNQGWVGTILASALALYLYRRSSISGIIAVQSRDVPMIGGSDAVFPAEVEVRYLDTQVPRLISSTIWIWNAGKKTVKGKDIVAHDPLRVCFSGEVLNVRIKKVSRKVVRITADTSGETANTIRYGFEFLDPGDGGVLEVLHTGSAKAPDITGTIIGLPDGLMYWGPAWGASASSRRERKYNRFLATLMLIIGLGMSVTGIIGERSIEQYIEEALPFLSEPQELDLQLPPWLGRGLLVLCGLLLSLFSAVFVWALRRSPSLLDVD